MGEGSRNSFHPSSMGSTSVLVWVIQVLERCLEKWLRKRGSVQKNDIDQGDKNLSRKIFFMLTAMKRY
jgi:hypothetical protein